jgi:hypothetical protein
MRGGEGQVPPAVILMRPTEGIDRRAAKRGWIDWLAAISAVVILLAQTVGIAHFHPVPSEQRYLVNASVSVDDGSLCALCLVRLHSPVAPNVAPHPGAPMLAALAVGGARSAAPHASYRSHLFGRAPPASV